MKHALLISACLAGFGLGCVAATVAKPLVVPPARAGTNPQRWEYTCFNDTIYKSAESVAQKSNQLGAQGWELSTSAAGNNEALWCFKRPL